MRIVAVLPALNEAESIGQVVQSILPFTAVIVVDDGSSDETAILARAAGAEVVSHSANCGYDKALETGLMKALELDFDYAITLDADGQHNAHAIKEFIKEFGNGADLVIGARDRHQRWAESLFSIVANLLWGIRDPLSGMKGYRLTLIHKLGHFDSYRSIGTEFSIRAARSGCKVHQIPIETFDRLGHSRFGAGLRANIRILRALWFGLLFARPFSFS